MSGVFGICDPQRRVEAQTIALTMSNAMRHKSWFVCESESDEAHNVALGRIGIGLFNKATQPLWNASRTVALTMAGEFYNAAALQPSGARLTDEQLALALYEQHGETFAQHLNGAFVIALWDRERQRLVITNDRFGLYPLFYAQHRGRFVFAPEMKGVLCDPYFRRELDLIALAQYVRFQHLLGERTFFEGLSLLPNASVLVYEAPQAQYKLTSYWTFADVPHRPQLSFSEAVSEAGRLLRRAIQRLSSDAYRPGVFLSGGLDSRTILGLTARQPVVSATFGMRHSRDVYYASQIARVCESQHFWFDLPDGQWVQENAAWHFELTEGLHSWIHMHGISMLPTLREQMDVNLSGWDGGTVMASAESPQWYFFDYIDDHALLAYLFQVFNQIATWPSINEAEERILLREPYDKQLLGVAFDSFRHELARFLHYRTDVRGEYFYLRQHCTRLTQNMITIARSHIEMRFPFFDYDLFDFIFSLPAQMRKDRQLYRALIQKEIPRLAYIPYDHDEQLPTTQKRIRAAHNLSLKIRNRMQRWLTPDAARRHTLYADYENYLRTDLRAWGEDLLLSERSLQRGYFNPDGLRALWQRHQSGLEFNYIGKIAPLMTLELVMRRFFDGAS